MTEEDIEGSNGADARADVASIGLDGKSSVRDRIIFNKCLNYERDFSAVFHVDQKDDLVFTGLCCSFSYSTRLV